jgi:hypothetical protein
MRGGNYRDSSILLIFTGEASRVRSRHNACYCRRTDVLWCLHEMLLHVDGDDAVFYAEAAQVAANLVNNSME